MARAWVSAVCVAACALAPAAYGQSTDPVKLLDHLAGNWVLTGTIAGKPTTHDVSAHWVLRQEYLEIHEVSRDKDASGNPAYEAIILVSREPKIQQYACLWMDSTAGGALTSPVACRAKLASDSIPFVFTMSPTESLHTTFTYRSANDTWRWTIDDEANGKTERFADVQLSRKR